MSAFSEVIYGWPQIVLLLDVGILYIIQDIAVKTGLQTGWS